MAGPVSPRSASPELALDDATLLQYADGELSDAEMSQVSALLERDAGAQQKLEALLHLGEAVRGDLELAADGVDARRFGAMWREIDKQLDTAPVGLWARLGSWFERHRGHVMTGAVTAGAVAAIALVMRPAPPVAMTPGTSASASVFDVQPVALREAPSIESLDTPDGDGEVINLEDEDGHTAVIWVTAADTVEGI